MDWFVNSLFIMIGAVFAENLVLTGGLGSGQMFRTGKKPEHLTSYGILMSGFIITTSIITWPFSNLLGYGTLGIISRPIAFILVVSALYIALVLIMKKRFSARYEKISKIIKNSAFNCVVVACPYIISTRAYDLGQAVFFAIGASVGFMLAILFVSEVLKTISNEDMPKAFRGLPIALIYIGILSLALLGISGKGIF